ncbi:MAG: histidine kinase [Bacteroides sp.]|jgi:sensor histidine kinase YesM|nr:histidine kinase [Bacteroides sp.]
MKRNQIILGFVISLGMAMLATVPFIRRWDAFEWNDIVLRGIYSFLTSLILWFGNLWLIYSDAFKRIIRSNIWRGVIIIFGVAILTNIICDYLLPLIFEKLAFTAAFPRIKRPVFLFSKCLFQSMMYYAILFVQQATEEKRKSQLELQQLKQAQMEAKILSLKEQLSPHFLFNTLNTLSTLTQEKEAQNFIQEMAKVYRYLLQYQEKNAATLKEELLFLDSYWYILKTRFEDSVSLSVEIPDKLMETAIPPLTLQMLIENVIKHNVANDSKPLAIKIYTDGKSIIVENSYQPQLNAVDTTGSGLKNIAQRYNLLFEKTIEINKDKDIFQVKLPIINQ